MLDARGVAAQKRRRLCCRRRARSAANLGEIFRVFRFRAARIAAAVGGGRSKRLVARQGVAHV